MSKSGKDRRSKTAMSNPDDRYVVIARRRRDVDLRRLARVLIDIALSQMAEEADGQSDQNSDNATAAPRKREAA